jgi:hypothetical protein
MAQPLRIMSLHALAYCERLFYLEEVEETRVADERVYAGRRLHVEIEKKEDQRTRKGNVLSQPDIPRRKKKSTVTDKTQKAAWETEPENAKEAEVETASADPTESDSSRDEGEPLRLTLESEKWGLTGKVDCIRRRDVYSFPTSIREDAPRALPITNRGLGPAIVCKSSLMRQWSLNTADRKSARGAYVITRIM